MFSKISAFLNSHVETSERNEDESLRTHYYKTTKDKMMNAISEWVTKDQRFSLLDESKERGELSVNVVKGKKGFLVITVTSVRPFRTGVDFSFTVEKGVNFGYGQKLIRQFYANLDKEHTFVGIGGSE
ncbi:hypothetical protein JOD43_003647 [Pullulanibacillus pueri]|nr:cytosolic protein [Pullulanibacillus pueri]MBM7683467.1 hypothetical protein [Pullulanibacillus pueri]